MASSRSIFTPMPVTGLGCFGAAGRSVAELWENALSDAAPMPAGIVAGKPVFTAPDPGLPAFIHKEARRADRSANLALAAGLEAWNSSGATQAGYDAARIGVFTGTSRGPVSTTHAEWNAARHKPSAAAYTSTASLPGLLALAIGAAGPALTIAASCVSSGAAILTACQMIRAGVIDVALAGGTDAALIEPVVGQFAAAGILAERIQPFDRNRSGTILGEGAAFVVIESPERAAARATGWIESLAIAAKPSSRVGMDGEVLCRVMREALEQSGSQPADIGCIHLHGTGTPVNDRVEAECVAEIFHTADQPLATASKGLTGHTLGAASGFQLILSLLAMKHGMVSPVFGCLEPAFPLRLVTGTPQPLPSSKTLCTTAGFWGNFSAMVLAPAT